MIRGLLSVSAWSILISACASQSPPEAAPPPAPTDSAALPPAPVQSSVSPAPEAAPKAAEPAAPPAPTPVFRVTEGISTPESVLYDEANDRYLVSNINGVPNATDNNGYITEISPDGKVTKAKFIAGGEGKVKLDAPKGSAIAAGILYVSDISVVRKFDAKTGAPKGDIPIPGATFLNDLAVAPDGRIFVSDSGVKPGANGFEPTGTDAVWVIDKSGKPKALAKGKELNAPNGIVIWDKGVLVNTLTSNQLYKLDEKGAKADVTELPDGTLDGLINLGDSLLVSSWKSGAVYQGKLGGKFEIVLTGFKDGPADIGFDSKRKRVLVPRFMGNAIEAYDLK
jgi:hypothetical protein